MKKLRPRLSVIALSALGMMVGQWVAGYLPSSLKHEALGRYWDRPDRACVN